MAIKRALLIGINYPGTSHALRGCINDMRLWNDVLTKQFGFTDSKEKRMLIDASATTDNIRERMEWLIYDLRAGDTIFLAFSGHGSQVVDIDYDLDNEPDGLDEIICPVDLNWRDKVIKDDEFRDWFDRVPNGVNITVVLDCCHSGSGIRSISDENLPLSLRDDTFGPTRVRGISMPLDIANRSYGKEIPIKSRSLYHSNDFAIAYEDQSGILLAGCADKQTAADAWIQPANGFYGAMTYYLIEELKSANFNISYRDLVGRTKTRLKSLGYSQDPELNGKEQYFDKPFLFNYGA